MVLWAQRVPKLRSLGLLSPSPLFPIVFLYFLFSTSLLDSY